MSIIQKLAILIFCILTIPTLDAQSALQKAESYAKLDAPFLSIKYLQKHIDKQKEDRNAMRLLANAYLQVNMVTQGQKWLLKANNSPAVFAYFQKINAKKKEITKELQNTDISIKEPVIPSNYSTKNNESKIIVSDRLMLVAAIGVVGMVM